MEPLNALSLYRARLRARWPQECLAAVGIAAGVALLFASQVSSSSLQSSVSELSRGIAGHATLQVLARSPRGMPESLLARVRAIRGVRAAAPVLESGANAIGRNGRSAAVQLIGADSSLARLKGPLVRDAAVRPFAGVGAVVLPAPVARAIGLSAFGQEVHFQLAGRTAELPLYSQLHERQVGSLAASALAIVPLASAQAMTGLAARLSRILVEPAAGTQRQVRAELLRLAAGRLNVEPIDHEEKLFAKAAVANNQSSALFAAVSALVGFLFAYNAMLLTVPQRRRLVLDLRDNGYTASTAIGVLLLDAVVLGVIACALGLALGEELSLHVLHSNPAFLSLAFAVGSQHIVTWQSIAIAAGGGMLATIAAVLIPLRDVLAHDPPDVLSARTTEDTTRSLRRSTFAGAACAGTATVLLIAAPDAAIPGMVLLVASLLLLLPLALFATLALFERLARKIVGAVAHVAVMELQTSGSRAVAITATGAIAIFGSVAIQGAHDDLLKGLTEAAHDTNGVSDVWIAPAGSYDLMSTAPFRPVEQRKLEQLPGVAAVRLYRGGLLDYGQRRALVLAPPSQSMQALLKAQIVQGDPRTATERVRAGGWLVLSQALASEHHLGVGQEVTLPTPDPRRMRIAALSTNLGWAPGAIVMSALDYARAWGSQDASAYNVQIASGFPMGRAVSDISRALGPDSGLAVHTAAERAAEQTALSRQALARLTQIAAMIPIIAVLAMVAAMSALLWQRRPRLAKLRLDGLPRVDLWGTVLLEGALLVGVGALTGAAFGLYGQQLADRALAQTVNFPIVPSITVEGALSSLALMITTALAILSIPGYVAASVPATLALAD
jgi:putative ABC transport system permease protein